MYATQKKVLESLVRIRTFLTEHPAGGTHTYAEAQATLDEVLQRVREHAGTQVSGAALNRGEGRQQKQLMTRLRSRHMRPIVAVARARTGASADVRFPAALQMPKGNVSLTQLLAHADGMMEVARPFESALVERGLPADSLARFRAAVEELTQVQGRRAEHRSAHVVARKAIHVELLRARRAVELLDAIVQVEFEGNEPVLEAWRRTKRAHLLPVSREVEGGTVVEAGGQVPEARPQQVTGAAAEGEVRRAA